MSRTAAPRLDPLAVRRTLRAEGLRASHGRSQNFLADPDLTAAASVPRNQESFPALPAGECRQPVR